MEEDNFQTLNIKYKIKKIKNKKRNIHNIEPFETLSNVKPLAESPNQVSTKDDHSYKEGFKEGRQNITDNDYEGLDDVLSQGGQADSIIAHELTNIINRIYIGLITFNCLIAFSIANGTRKGRPDSEACGGDIPTSVEYTDPETGKTKKKGTINMDYIASIIDIDFSTKKYGQVLNTEPITGGNEDLDPGLISDANAVYRYVCLFEAVLATFSFTFIWFYLIFYSYSNGIQNQTFFNIFNREKLRKSENVIVKILFFCLEYGIAVFEDIRWAVEKKFPEYALIVNRPFCFLILFWIILEINNKYLSYLKDLLIDILHVNYKNFFVVILYLIVVYELIGAWVIGNAEDAKKASSGNPVDQVSIVMGIAVKIMPLILNPFSVIPVAIYKLIKEIFRLIIALAFSVPVAAMLCVSYFLYLSLIFPFYKIFKDSFVEDIYNYIRSEGAFSDRDPCNIPTTYWEKINDNILNFFSYLCIAIFNVLPYLVPIIFAAYFIRINLLEGINCPGTSKFLQGINFLILALGILGLVLHFRGILKASAGLGLNVFSILVTPPMDRTLSFINYFNRALLCVLILSAVIFMILSAKAIVEVIIISIDKSKNKAAEKASDIQQKASSNTPGST